MEFRITLTGTAPLIMHNTRLADPLDEITKALKEVTSKRAKTDADHVEIARLEHMGGLYFDKVVGPYVPGENIQRCLVDGAKLTRAGMKITRGVFVTTNVNVLAYHGPRTIDGLWADENFRLTRSVVVQRNKTTRTRPIFREWAVEADGQLDDQIINLRELEQVADSAGRVIGLGDWRPRYGRFHATVEKL